MRWTRRWGLVLLAACGTHAASIDAAPDTSSPDVLALDLRLTSAVVVGDTTVSWARGPESCTLPRAPTSDCVPPGPIIMTASLAAGVPTTLAESVDGVTRMVGDDSELFYVYASRNGPIVERMRPGGSTQLISPPLPNTINGLVLDATNVYWGVQGVTPDQDSIWRASRSGDGSDATMIAQGTLGGGLVAFAGYVWSTECPVPCTVRRVAIAGGTPEVVTTGFITLGASADALYLGNYPARDQIVAMTADGTMNVVVDQLSSEDAPTELVVADRGELFWRTRVELLRVPATGGSPTAVPGLTLSDSSLPFGVTADAILYNFTRDGYQTAPR